MFALSALLTGAVAFLLMQQPDFGSTIIFGCVWIAMLALAGVSLRMLGVLAVAGWSASSSLISSTTSRPRASTASCSAQGDTFQTDNAMRTLTAGGLFGMGPGGGTRKFGLPEPHTDYIFSVIGEEFGLIACLAIALLYLHRRPGAGQIARRGIDLRDPRRGRASPSSSGCRR